MKCESGLVRTVVFLLAVLTALSCGQETGQRRNRLSASPYHDSRIDKIISKWNKSIEVKDWNEGPVEPQIQEHPSENADGPDRGLTFIGAIRRCVSDRKQEIIGSFNRGKVIIVNCFKAGLILTILKYLMMSPNTRIKIFNGVLEFVKISENPVHCESLNDLSDCNERPNGHIEDGFLSMGKKEFLYERVVRRVVDEDREISSMPQNSDEKGKTDFERVINYLVNRSLEKKEEDEMKRELADPKLLSVLNALSRHYLMKINFYPSLALEMKRSLKGDLTLDLVTEESRGRKSKKNEDGSQDRDEDDEDDEGDDDDDDDDDDEDDDDDDDDDEKSDDEEKEDENEGDNELESFEKTGKKKVGQGKNGYKKKKKKLKKFKHFKHLLIPFIIQLAILPFFLKNLLFLAVKALLAGKAALLLVVFNMLRNSKVEDENYNIRVEHYGYRKGEEYGAWINGRSFQGRSGSNLVENLSDEPYRRYRPQA